MQKAARLNRRFQQVLYHKIKISNRIPKARNSSFMNRGMIKQTGGRVVLQPMARHHDYAIRTYKRRIGKTENVHAGRGWNHFATNILSAHINPKKSKAGFFERELWRNPV